MMTTERPLTNDEKERLTMQSQKARTLLLAEDARSSAVEHIALIDAFVDKWQNERREVFQRFLKPRGPSATDIALALGALWGQHVVHTFRWQWALLAAARAEVYAVISPDRALVIYPVKFLETCLADPSLDCTVALSFNMLAAGSIQGIPAGAYQDVMDGVWRIVPKR